MIALFSASPPTPAIHRARVAKAKWLSFLPLVLAAAVWNQTGHAAELTVGNKQIAWYGVVRDKQVKPRAVVNRDTGKSLPLEGPCFWVKLGNGTVLSSHDFVLAHAATAAVLPVNAASPRAADHMPGRQIKFDFINKAAGIKADWSVRVRQGCNYLQLQLVLHALAGPVNIDSITLLNQPLKDARRDGSVAGSPIVTRHFFLGYENPMARNIVRSGSRVLCRLERNAPLVPGGKLTASCVIGEYKQGQLRRDFLTYIENARARPYQPFLLYVSWYDVSFGGKYSQAACVRSINAIGRELVKKRGVKINSFLFDDGWDKRNSMWQFNSGFPHGFTPLARAAAKFHAHVGVWLSPFGGYGEARNRRLAYAKAHGYEIDSGGLSLSGKKYYHLFANVCLQMIHRYGVNAFKFDGLAAGARAAAAGQTLDGDAMLRLIAALRRAEPRVYINQTTGTWPSPFWLLNVDSTWRGGYDHNFIGAGSWCQKWITYRDAATWANVVQRGPLYPLNSLMLHGIIYAAHTGRLHSMSDRGFADQVWSYFGTGTQLQELYITPSLLDKNNWDVLAKAARWSRRNSAVLVDTHWIGGDPARGQIYGWAAWAGRNAIITLRNPDAIAETFTIHLGRVLQLPHGAAGRYQFVSPQSQKKHPNVVTIAAGIPYTIRLSPFQVKVLEGNAKAPKSGPAPTGPVH